MLVVSSSTLRTVPPGGSQSVYDAISYLASNGFIEIERDGASVRISAGPKLRKLYGT